jgi:hypothetical protein
VSCDCGSEMRVAANDLLQGLGRKCDKGGHPKVFADERFIRKLYGNYRHRARKRYGVPFEIPYGAFKVAIAWNCVYCGIEPAGDWIRFTLLKAMCQVTQSRVLGNATGRNPL